MEHNETRLQIAVAHYLRGEVMIRGKTQQVQCPFPGLVWTAIPGDAVDKETAFWAKMKGYEKESPDFVAWDRVNGKSLMMAVETKSDTGTQRRGQMNWQWKFEEKGGLYGLCRTVAQVRDFFIRCGLTCRNFHCIEPKASIKQQLAFQAEMYRND